MPNDRITRKSSETTSKRGGGSSRGRQAPQSYKSNLVVEKIDTSAKHRTRISVNEQHELLNKNCETKNQNDASESRDCANNGQNVYEEENICHDSYSTGSSTVVIPLQQRSECHINSDDNANVICESLPLSSLMPSMAVTATNESGCQEVSGGQDQVTINVSSRPQPKQGRLFLKILPQC